MSDSPWLLTRVGREHPAIQERVDQFLAVALKADVIRVDEGQHGFDMLDDTEESREAVSTARDAVVRLADPSALIA